MPESRGLGDVWANESKRQPVTLTFFALEETVIVLKTMITKYVFVRRVLGVSRKHWRVSRELELETLILKESSIRSI